MNNVYLNQCLLVSLYSLYYLVKYYCYFNSYYFSLFFYRRHFSVEHASSSDKMRKSTGSNLPPVSYGSSDRKVRKSSFNLFERFKLSKQDKIAADVQRKIRAVRAAEDFDRRVNAKRSKY